MNAIEEWLTQPDGLAARLRALRTQAGLSGKDLAEALGWQPSKVSRLENGRQMAAPTDLEEWTRGCGGTPDTATDLKRMLDEAQAVHRDFKLRMRRGQAAVQASYNELVQRSQLIRYFETVYVPGFLQTPEYARRVLTEMIGLHGLAIDDIDAAITTRLQRQQLLYDPTKRFEFLLCEPVLRWLLTTPEIMRGQLDRLQTIVGLPNIRFGILPLGTRLATTPQNAFQIYDDLVIVETFIGETVYHDDAAAAYSRAMDRLWNEAVTGEDARRLIVLASHDLPPAPQ